MKIYTKTGDKGDTSLFGGKRVPKDNVRIEAYGTIDELNAFLGVLHDTIENLDQQQLIEQVQNNLFTIGSLLANEGKSTPYIPDLSNEAILSLETAIDDMDALLPPLKNFILPSGHTMISFCHIARCVCRRAERRLVELDHSEAVDPKLLKFLNRLSDYLFVLSRKIAFDLGVKEIVWKSRD